MATREGCFLLVVFRAVSSATSKFANLDLLLSTLPKVTALLNLPLPNTSIHILRQPIKCHYGTASQSSLITHISTVALLEAHFDLDRLLCPRVNGISSGLDCPQLLVCDYLPVTLRLLHKSHQPSDTNLTSFCYTCVFWRTGIQTGQCRLRCFPLCDFWPQRVKLGWFSNWETQSEGFLTHAHIWWILLAAIWGVMSSYELREIYLGYGCFRLFHVLSSKRYRPKRIRMKVTQHKGQIRTSE